MPLRIQREKTSPVQKQFAVRPFFEQKFFLFFFRPFPQNPPKCVLDILLQPCISAAHKAFEKKTRVRTEIPIFRIFKTKIW